MGERQPVLAGTAEHRDDRRLTGIGRVLESGVEDVGEFGGHRVRRLVEDGERDEERLVTQPALIIGEPAGDLCLDGLLAEGGQFLRVGLAAVYGDEPSGELLDRGRGVLPGNELLHRGEPAQLRPRRFSDARGDVRVQHLLGGRWLPPDERNVVQGRRRLHCDHQVAPGALQPVAQAEQVRLAQRVAPGGGEVQQEVSVGAVQMGEQCGQRAGLDQIAHGTARYPVQQHQCGGPATRVPPAGQDHDLVGTEPAECLVEARAAAEDVRQLRHLLGTHHPGEVRGGFGGRAEVVVHVAVDRAAADAELVAADLGGGGGAVQGHDVRRAVLDQRLARGPGLLPLPFRCLCLVLLSLLVLLWGLLVGRCVGGCRLLAHPRSPRPGRSKRRSPLTVPPEMPYWSPAMLV